MPNYSFRCEAGCQFDAMFEMSQVPRATECRECGAAARRIVTAPHLSQSGSSSFQTVEHSLKSAHEPDVVRALPSVGTKKPQRTTWNPLHQKLPRS